jgi:antitoxin component YwqK of YwqJK toxin-antitoxin module
MANTRKSPQPHIHYHKDGSIWGKGQRVGDTMVGYWEWFRKDGTRMRSGCFKNGEQTGEWTTYDKKGEVYKVTQMKPKSARKTS